MKPVSRGNLSQTIASNTFLYGLELGFSILVALLTTIPMARIIGPANLSYFVYLQWLTNISGVVALVGIPATARKYMAEFLGAGRPDLVWATYRACLRAETAIAAALLVTGTLAAQALVPPSYRLIAFLLLLNVAIKLVACIPSSAHQAAENLRPNLMGSLANGLITLVGVNFSLWWNQSLTGVALSFSAGMAAETVIKFRALRTWLVRKPEVVLPADLKKRMFQFSGQGMIMLVLNLVVWDRSGLVFLKMLDKDPRQLTFYSVTFNMVDKILLLPSALSRSIETSLVAEYGRNWEKFLQAAGLSVKYALLVAAPLMLGLAALASPVTRLAYGGQYLPAIPVLAIAAALAVSKPLLVTAQGFLQAREQQGFLILWSTSCGALNIILDLTLIPPLGARGAMTANGVAQTMVVLGLWFWIARKYSVQVFPSVLLRILLSAGMMAALVAGIGLITPNAVLHAAAGVPLGAVIYFTLLRRLRVLDGEDVRRALLLVRGMPAQVQKYSGGLGKYLASR